MNEAGKNLLYKELCNHAVGDRQSSKLTWALSAKAPPVARGTPEHSPFTSSAGPVV